MNIAAYVAYLLVGLVAGVRLRCGCWAEHSSHNLPSAGFAVLIGI